MKLGDGVLWSLEGHAWRTLGRFVDDTKPELLAALLKTLTGA